MSALVLPQSVTPARAEQLYRRAADWAFRPIPNIGKAETGMRLARLRHPLLLKGLESCAEVLTQMAEDQYGQTKRQASTPYAYTFDPSVVKAFQEALTGMESGRPEEALGYLYAAVAEFAGIIV